jgi:hypothetical protein
LAGWSVSQSVGWLVSWWVCYC